MMKACASQLRLQQALQLALAAGCGRRPALLAAVEAAAAGRLLPWHFLGAQEPESLTVKNLGIHGGRVLVLGYLWRASVCNVQNVVKSIIPDELRVYACEETSMGCTMCFIC
ncbi:unnamed protein product [Symbiodinium pilosum]|uniref:Uncharacterized protein n=1 Tax=Symbiodinium pilosum TaxID=2952 RepID=A0A812XHV5_SYMPI|nr:unnamed protein product [Symbiodinium pilosum]